MVNSLNTHPNTYPNSKVVLNYASLELLKDKSFLDQVWAWLSAEEQKRYKSFVSQQQANQFLLARVLLRSQLSKRVPIVLPNEWVFVVDDYGKPRLSDKFSYLNLHFNLSHSENLVVLVLAEGEVELGADNEIGKKLNLGIDVENIHRPIFSMALAKRYFSESELTDLAKLAEQQQVKRIAQLWTLKESYLKTNGLGVRVPLNKLEFCFEEEGGLNIDISDFCVQSLPSKERSFIGLFNLSCFGSQYSLALTIEADKKMDASILVISEWAGLDNQFVGIQCELLRNNEALDFAEISV